MNSTEFGYGFHEGAAAALRCTAWLAAVLLAALALSIALGVLT